MSRFACLAKLQRSSFGVGLISIVAAGVMFLNCTTDNAQSLSILQDQAINQANNSCVVPATVTSSSRSIGILDVGVVEGGYDGYHVFPLMQNNLIDRTIEGIPLATDSITVLGLDIQLIPDDTLAAVLPVKGDIVFSASFGGVVPPAGLVAMAAPAITRATALQLGTVLTGDTVNYPIVTVRMRATGMRTNSTVKSNWVTFPVQLCRWCLSGGPPAACPVGGYLSSDVKKGGCGSAQDESVTCCLDANNYLLCGTDVPISSS